VAQIMLRMTTVLMLYSKHIIPTSLQSSPDDEVYFG
jgi:hypothetical protein